jgi:signal transduction histidine kinase
VTNRRKLTQLKDDFISVASHELRTPVTSLKAALQLLNQVKDNPSAGIMPKLIDQANKSLNKLSNLIADLLNVSRLKQGRLFLNKTTFTLSELISDCGEHIQILGNHTLKIEGALDLQVSADSDRIDQVITNLVNNAVKYAPESKQIKVHIEKQKEDVRVSVIDKGPGITSEKLPYLFESYYRVHTDNFQYSGLGLGLYISSEIIKKHSGQIGVDSVVGKGSTFWFTLPLS